MEISEIRNLLRECENSIIFAMLERARWKSNRSAYIYSDANDNTNHDVNDDSLFNRMLIGTELVHAKLGRYACPEEHPFTEIVVGDTFTNKIVLTNYKIGNYLDKRHSSINLNKTVLEEYFKTVLPKITEEGEDENLGSAVTADINLLQAISRRIHLGKLVAQAKYNSEKDWYRQPRSQIEIYDKLTNQRVEDAILERLGKKLKNFTCDTSSSLLQLNFDIDVLKYIYRDFIIPTTKQVQISYFRLLLD